MGYIRAELGSLGHDGLGAVAPAESPVGKLVSQVNRFGPGAPAGYQYAPAPFRDTGVVSMDLAIAAITIYLRRATDSYNQFHDAGSAAAIAAANLGFAAPVEFVTGRLADVTSTIAGFADSLGLPTDSAVIGGVPWWGIGLAVVGAWLVLKPSRKGR